MRNYVKKIFEIMLSRAFDSTDDNTRMGSMLELEDFSAHLVSQGVTHFNDVSGIYKVMNQYIIKHASGISEDQRYLNSDEVSQLIEWVPLERQTVEVISNHADISDTVVHRATKKLIEQGIFWDDDGNGPDSLIETLFLDNRAASGYMYLEALRESGEEEKLLASALSTSLADAIRSEDNLFIGYFRDHDHDICLLLDEHKKLERFRFQAAAKLCMSGANSLAITIGKEMMDPTSEDLLMLDERGKTDFIEACIDFHERSFRSMSPSAYLKFLSHAICWPGNAFSVPLNYTSEDVYFAFADGKATLYDEFKGLPFFNYVAGRFKSGPDELVGILKLAIKEGWLDESLAIVCIDNNLDALTPRFNDITEIFRCEWLHQLNIQPLLGKFNKIVIHHLKNHGTIEDIITVFHNDDLLEHLDWDALIEWIDDAMANGTEKGRTNICDAIPLKLHKHFNSIKRYTLERDMNL